MSNLKILREASGLSQSGLAEKTGVNARIIQHYEQGFRDINKAQAITLYHLAKVLNVSIEDILEIKKEDAE